MNTDLIFILDMGGGQAYYTARRLRGEQFYCEVIGADTPIEEIIQRQPKGIILAGGDSEAERANRLPFDPECFGVPLMAFGGAARMLAERIGAEYLGRQLSCGKEFVQFKLCDLFSELSENDRYFERIDGYNLPDQMVQTTCACGADVHAGTHAHSVKAFEHGDISCGISLCHCSLQGI